jgi:hypothetical protein
MYELFNKYSVVVVRLTPSPPQRGRHPKGNPPDPRIMQNFQLTSLPSEGPTRRPSDPQRGGNARKIQKTSFVNRWFELNVKKLFEMLGIYPAIQDFYRTNFLLLLIALPDYFHSVFSKGRFL